MAIAVADILTAANGRTGRAESDVDTFMKGVLHELSSRGLALSDDEAFSLTTDDADILFTALTKKFNKIKIITIDDSNGVPSEPLRRINWDKYQVRLSENLSSSEPTEFCIHPPFGAKTLYLSPKPNATNYPTANISGTLIHDDTTTINYPNEYRELLIAGVCWLIEAKYKIDGSKTVARFKAFEREISIMWGNVPTIGHVKYNDI